MNTDLVRTLRVNKNWSQEDLAEASGISSRTIQRIENSAEASLETRRALANAFGIDAADLELKPSTQRAGAVRGAKWGIGGATIGYSGAFAGVTHALLTGSITATNAGITLGVLGAATGVICFAIGYYFNRV
ncbi:MAG: helix-turn-helix domain-containing protein [Pseudomonadales bacterium]